MKNIVKPIVFCLGSLVFAQNVQNYAYVTPATELSDFKDNKYGLSSLLEKLLAKKNYIVLPSDKLQWPAEASQNPCGVLTADLINSSSLLKNKVKVAFKDCNDKVIAKFEGTSLEKEYEVGYPDALNKALATIPASSPTEMPKAQPLMPQPVQQIASQPAQNNVTSQPQQVSGSLRPAPSVSKGAEVYSFGGINYNRITLSPDQFILVSTNNSVPFATFKQSGLSGVYHVKLQNGANALGYFNGNKLVIESPNDNGYSRQELIKN